MLSGILRLEVYLDSVLLFCKGFDPAAVNLFSSQGTMKIKHLIFIFNLLPYGFMRSREHVFFVFFFVF